MIPPRKLREKLAPDFLREIVRHDAKVEAHMGPVWDPRVVHALIQDASSARASDIHIEPGSMGATVRFRIDGVISDVARLTSSQASLITNQLKALANLDPVVSFIPKNAHASCALASGPLDLRLALTPSQAGEAMTVRLLDPNRLQRAIDDLGLSEAGLQLLESWIEDSVGMFLAAGPTGCGKSTTVYCCTR